MNTPNHENSIDASNFACNGIVDRLYARYHTPVGLIDVRHSQKKYEAMINWLKNRFPLSAQLLIRSDSDGDFTLAHDSLILQNPPRSAGHLIQQSAHYESNVIHPANNEAQLRRISATVFKTREITRRPDRPVNVRADAKAGDKSGSSSLQVNAHRGDKPDAPVVAQQHSQTVTAGQTFFSVARQMETATQQTVPAVQSAPIKHSYQEAGAQAQWTVRRPGLADLYQPANNAGQNQADPGQTPEIQKAAPSNPTPSSILPIKGSKRDEFTRITRLPKIKNSASNATSLPVLFLNATNTGGESEIRHNSPKPIPTPVQYPDLEFKPKSREIAGGKSEQMAILSRFTHTANQELMPKYLESTGGKSEQISNLKRFAHAPAAVQELTPKTSYKAENSAMIWRTDREKAVERPGTSKKEMSAQRSETFQMDPDTVQLIENRTAPRLETRDIRFSKREWAQLVETLSQVVWKKLLIDFDRRGIRAWR